MTRVQDSSSQIPATPADLLALAAEHGLQLTTDGEYDTTGLDFLVVHARDAAGTPWIVRTPRRPEVYASSLIEARVLAHIAPRLPFAVPEWRVHAPGIIAYPRIVGTPAISVTAEGPAWHLIDPTALPSAFVDSHARALAALQAISPDEAREAGVPFTSIADAREELAAVMLATRDALEPPAAVWSRWHRWLADDEMWPEHVALVHGDLHPGHMLLDDDARVVGVLDWTEARVTDPSIDLAMFLGCFSRAALVDLTARFAAAGGRTWPRLVDHAAERWAAFPPLAAAWAQRSGNDGIMAHARAQVAALAAEMTA